MEDNIDLSGAYSAGGLRRRRLAGPFLLVILAGIGGAIDAANPPLTIDGFVSGAILAAPIVVPITVELILRGASDDVELSIDWIPGLPGRLVVYSIAAGVCWFILFLLFAIALSAVTSLAPPVVPFSGAEVDVLFAPAVGLSGLVVCWMLPIRLLTARNVTVEPSSEPDSPGQGPTESAPSSNTQSDNVSVKPLQEELQNARKSYVNDQLTEAGSTLQDLRAALEDSDVAGMEVSEIEEESTRLRLKLEVAKTIQNRDQAQVALNEDDLAGAQSAVEEASESLTKAATLADQENYNTEPIQELRSDLEDLKDEIQALQEVSEADQKVVGLLDSIRSAIKQAEEHLNDDDEEAALKEVVSAFETCEKATTINETKDLGRGNEIVEIRSELQDLADKVQRRFERRVDELLEKADQALNDGDHQTVLRTIERIDDLLEKQRVSNHNVTQESIDSGTKIKQELQDQLDEYIAGQVAAAEETIESSKALIEAEEYEHALSQVEDEVKACEQAIEIAQNVQHDRTEDVEELLTVLEELGGRAETLAEMVAKAEKQRETVQRSIQSRDFETAEKTLTDLEANLESLKANQAPSPVIERFSTVVAEFEQEVSAGKEASRVDGLLGSVTSAHQQAEELLEDGSRERAIRRLESAQRSLEEAATLNAEYEFGRDSAIQQKRERNRSLLDAARGQPAEDLIDLLAEAEELVSEGINRREADAFPEAVEAFERALTKYETALNIAEDNELPQAWEVEQRHSMVAEYVAITREERDDRQQSVQSDLEEALDEAESELKRAEQHAEVEDHISARESLADALGHLDEATQLIETGMATESLQATFDDLAARADTLHAELPDEETTGEYRTSNLVESLQMLATKLGESPRPEFVNAYGEYPADAYLESFGSWPEALAAANLDPIDEEARERRTYSRVEILDALSRVAEDLGRPPSPSEMNELGDMSASPVQSRFSDWDTALELVGIKDEQGDQELDSSDPSSAEGKQSGAGADPELSPNELAEVYDIFSSIKSTLEALIAANESVSEGDGSPLAEWYDAIYDRWGGSGFEGAPNYGYQQANRNDFSMKEYREAFGDGERVTEFNEIEVRPLFDYDQKVLSEYGIIDENESFPQPVAPESNVRLPIVVEKESRLSKGLEMLDEFPESPTAETTPEMEDMMGDSAGQEKIEADDEPEASTEDSEMDDSGGQEADIVNKLLDDLDLGSDAEAAHD